MGDSPRSRRPTRFILLASCAAAALLLAACGSNGEPADGGDIGRGDVSDGAAAGVPDVTSLGYDDAAAEHFMQSCERSAVVFGSATGPVAQRYCGCVWDEMVARIPFEEMLPMLEFFAGVDGLDDDAATLAPTLLAIEMDCRDRHPPSSGDYTVFVEANFKRSCEPSINDPALRPAAAQICACAWDRIVAEIPFEDFVALEEALRNDPDGVPGPAAASAGRAFAAITVDCAARHAPG